MAIPVLKDCTMTRPRKARRTKTLDVEMIDETKLRFELGLEDKGFSDVGEEPIHSLEIFGEISVPDLEILSIEAKAILQPYDLCRASIAPVSKLVGARIGPGFRARVLEAMGRTAGCTHFLTMLLDLTAAHTLSVFLRISQRTRYADRNSPDPDWTRVGLDIEPQLVNACIALGADSPIIQKAKEKSGKS